MISVVNDEIFMEAHKIDHNFSNVAAFSQANLSHFPGNEHFPGDFQCRTRRNLGETTTFLYQKVYFSLGLNPEKYSTKYYIYITNVQLRAIDYGP